MIGRWGSALLAASAVACGGDAVRVERAPVVLPAGAAEVFADGDSVAVAAVLDDGDAREVTLSAEAQVSLRAYGATVTRAAQPAAARALTAGARATLDVHVAITQYAPGGDAVGRIENPFEGAAGRARFASGRSYLTVLGGDETDAAAWRVLDAYALDAAGAALAEPALGFAAGTTVETLFAALHPP